MISKLRTHWRKEMIYLGLAAMECCWLYPWQTLLLGAGRQARRIPPTGLLTVLLLALYVTRLLHQRRVSLQAQRVVTIALALLGTLLMLRLYVYVDYRLTDLSWLGRFAWETGNVLQRIHASLVIFFTSLYLWWRGIQLAQRDLGVESVGFSFRAGIVAFLWLFLAGVFFFAPDAVPFTFLYFFVGLTVMGLARIEDVSRSHVGIRSPFNTAWMGILGSSAVMISALSLLIVNLFSLRNIAALAGALRSVLAWIWRFTIPLQVAAAWLLQFILSWLIRFFQSAFGGEEQDLTALTEITEQLQEFQQSQPFRSTAWIVQLIKWGVLGLFFAGALFVLAFSISRVQRALQESRSAEHESVWDTESAAQDVRDAVESRWRRWREGLLARLAKLRGQEYSLASIRKTYASLARLAAASGHARPEAETPYEYIATLQQAFPGSEKEVQLITDAYVRVHYGERSFRPEYVQRVRDAWLAIHTRQEQSNSSQSVSKHAQ